MLYLDFSAALLCWAKLDAYRWEGRHLDPFWLETPPELGLDVCVRAVEDGQPVPVQLGGGCAAGAVGVGLGFFLLVEGLSGVGASDAGRLRHVAVKGVPGVVPS